MNRFHALVTITFTLLLFSCKTTQVYIESGITNLTQITTDRAFKLDPSWSIESEKEIRSEIWVIDLQGRNATQLTAFKGLNISPSWSPDGKIAFVSSRGDSWDIWSMTPLGNK